MLEKGGWTQKNLESHHKTILGFKQLLCSHQIHTDPMSFDSNVCLSHSGPLMLSIFAHQSVFFPSLPYLFLKIPHDSSTLWLQRETLLFKFGFMKTKHPLMNTCDCERLWQEKIMLKWKKQTKLRFRANTFLWSGFLCLFFYMFFYIQRNQNYVSRCPMHRQDWTNIKRIRRDCNHKMV